MIKANIKGIISRYCNQYILLKLVAISGHLTCFIIIIIKYSILDLVKFNKKNKILIGMP